MTVNKIKYGISYLPEDCLAYKDGYRYGAFCKQQQRIRQSITQSEHMPAGKEVYHV